MVLPCSQPCGKREDGILGMALISTEWRQLSSILTACTLRCFEQTRIKIIPNNREALWENHVVKRNSKETAIKPAGLTLSCSTHARVNSLPNLGRWPSFGTINTTETSGSPRTWLSHGHCHDNFRIKFSFPVGVNVPWWNLAILPGWMGRQHVLPSSTPSKPMHSALSLQLLVLSKHCTLSLSNTCCYMYVVFIHAIRYPTVTPVATLVYMLPLPLTPPNIVQARVQEENDWSPSIATSCNGAAPTSVKRSPPFNTTNYRNSLPVSTFLVSLLHICHYLNSKSTTHK